MKVLLTGADGQAGRALQASRPPWAELKLTTEQTLDICELEAVKSLVNAWLPDIVVNAAAYTDVEKAESHADAAHAVNSVGAGNLAIAAAGVQSKMCHISTDYVFDNDRAVPIRPDHSCNPGNVYGLSKRNGEMQVLDTLGNACCIIRTSWLYYQGGANFVETMLRLMSERDSIRVIADQFGAPTSATSLAKAIWAAINVGACGIHHWRDAGIASWYDFASAIADIGHTSGRFDRLPEVLPITTAEYPTKARRPIFSLLDTTETERVIGLKPRHWRSELHDMMERTTNA